MADRTIATPQPSVEERFTPLPPQSNHSDRATRFVYWALAEVVGNRIPVRSIDGWDDNAYNRLSVLARQLDQGLAPLSEYVWKETQIEATKEQHAVAAAVASWIGHGQAKEAELDDDELSDQGMDHVYLHGVLEFDNKSNPLAAYADGLIL